MNPLAFIERRNQTEYLIVIQMSGVEGPPGTVGGKISSGGSIPILGWQQMFRGSGKERQGKADIHRRRAQGKARPIENPAYLPLVNQDVEGVKVAMTDDKAVGVGQAVLQQPPNPVRQPGDRLTISGNPAQPLCNLHRHVAVRTCLNK